MQWIPTSPMGPPKARVGSLIQARGATGGRVGELGVGELRGADGSCGDEGAHALDAGVVAHVLGDAEVDACVIGCGEHLLDLGGAHRERLFAENGLAVGEGEEDVLEVERVRGDDEDDVNLGRGAEGFGGVEDVGDGVVAGVVFGFGEITAVEAFERRVVSELEGGDEALGGVVAEAEDAVAGSLGCDGAGHLFLGL